MTRRDPNKNPPMELRKSLCLHRGKTCSSDEKHGELGRGLEFVNHPVMTKRILQNIADALVNRGETIAIAESVTSGLLMMQLSLAENATDFFQGGITAYNIGQKTRQLSVDPIYADKVNCVSHRISEQMAIQVAAKFCSDWGIGITGYAVPVPALKIRSCFAYHAISYKGKIVLTSRVDAPKKSQAIVQHHFVNSILKDLAKVINEI
jgi:PncC family amidohydrolase